MVCANPLTVRRFASAGVVPWKIWSHVAVVWNGDRLTIYVNGNPLCTTNTERDHLDPVVSTLTIGNGGTSFDRVTGFNGDIDEVRIYRRALDASELRERYCTLNPAKEH